MIHATPHRWYTTGHTCPLFGYKWADLIAFLAKFEDLRIERLK